MFIILSEHFTAQSSHIKRVLNVWILVRNGVDKPNAKLSINQRHEKKKRKKRRQKHVCLMSIHPYTIECLNLWVKSPSNLNLCQPLQLETRFFLVINYIACVWCAITARVNLFDFLYSQICVTKSSPHPTSEQCGAKILQNFVS